MEKWINIDSFNQEIKNNKQLEENLKLPDWLIDLKREQYEKEDKEREINYTTNKKKEISKIMEQDKFIRFGKTGRLLQLATKENLENFHNLIKEKGNKIIQELELQEKLEKDKQDKIIINIRRCH